MRLNQKRLRKIVFFLILYLYISENFNAFGQWSGSGTSVSPYLITNISQLNTLQANVNGGIDYNGVYFQLTANLDLSGEWMPIGNSTRQFKGNFDGNNKKIKGLYINKPLNDCVGLFGYLAGGSILNLSVETTPSGVTGGSSVGVLVGYQSGGTIYRCYAGGYLNASDYAGGLVGQQKLSSNCTVEQCYVFVDINSPNNINGAAGLIGGLRGSVINSYAAGNVSGINSTGGLVGVASDNGIVSGCYALGEVKSTTSGSRTGGLCGYQSYATSLISNSIAINPQVINTANSQTVNRLIGQVPSRKKNSNNYAWEGTTVQVGGRYENLISDPDDFDGFPQSVSILQEFSFYTNTAKWTSINSSGNPVAAWNIWDRNSYPYLQFQSCPPKVTGIFQGSIQGEFRPDIMMDSIVAYKRAGTSSLRLGRTAINNTSRTWTYTMNGLDYSETIYFIAYQSGKTVPSYPVYYTLPCAPLNGTYTIKADGTGDFLSLKDFSVRYNACGLSGNTIIRIASNITESSTVPFSGIAPGSDVYTLTITSDGQQRVISGQISGDLLSFSSAQNITIDGGVVADTALIRLGVNNTRLIFQNMNTSGTISALHIKDGKNITVKNATFLSSNISGSRGIFVENLIDSNTTEFSGCCFSLSDAGLYIKNSQNIKVTGNAFFEISRIAAYYWIDNGIQGSCQITDNTVKILGNGTQTTMYGIYCNASASTGNILIKGNTINSISNGSVNTGSILYGCLVIFSGNAKISNNHIYNMSDNNSTNANGGIWGIRAYLYNSAHVEISNCVVQNVQAMYLAGGIYVQKRNAQSSYIVNNCQVKNIRQTGINASSYAIGMRVDGGGTFNANQITDITNASVFNGSYTAGFHSKMASEEDNQQLLVTNNMIGFNNHSYDIRGIYADASFLPNQRFLHNTIYISENASGSNPISDVYYTSTPASNLQFENNLWVNRSYNTPKSFIYVNPSVQQGIISFMNNRYLPVNSKLANIAENTYVQLTDWNSFLSPLGGDNAKIADPVTFVSSTNQHLSGASITDNNLYVPVLKDAYQDYDGDYRSDCYNAAGADSDTPLQLISVREDVGCQTSSRTISAVINSFLGSYTYDIDFSGIFKDVNTVTSLPAGDSITVSGIFPDGNHIMTLKNPEGCSMQIPFSLHGYDFPELEVKDLLICYDKAIVNLDNAITRLQNASMENVQFSHDPQFSVIIPDKTDCSVNVNQTIYARVSGDYGCYSPIRTITVRQGNILQNDYVVLLSNSKNNAIHVTGNDLYGCCKNEEVLVSPSKILKAKHGMVSSVSNQLIYTPDLNWGGIDSLRYIVDCSSKKDSAMVYILASRPASGKYYACPNVSDTLKIIADAAIQYNWYATETGGTQVAKGSNTNYIKVVKNNDPVEIWWVEARYGNMIFPRFPVEFFLSESCGTLTPVECIANGTLLFREDFNGNNIGDPDISLDPLPGGRSNYTFTNNTIFPNMSVERYCLVKKGPDTHETWHSYDDHTFPDDKTRGYFMAVDASTIPGRFYSHTISGLCPGTVLYFSIWMGNLMKKTRYGEYSPSLRFLLIDAETNIILAQYSSGVMENTPTPLWKQYGFSFTSSSPSVRLEIYSNTREVSGNDLVLDDLEIHTCIPPVKITGPLTYCPNDPLDLTVKNNDDSNLRADQTVNWLFSENGDMGTNAQWDTIQNITSVHLDMPVTRSGYLRAVAGSQGAIDAKMFNCCSISDPTHILVTPDLMYWRRNSVDNDWNNPLNWVDKDDVALNAVPNKCTDVHIPGNSKYYPDLSENYSPRTENYGDPRCRDITYHFGSEVAKPQYLTYRKAYIQYNFGYYEGTQYVSDWETHSSYPMERGHWYVLAAPLKHIVSGDFSIGGFPNMWQQGFKSSPDRKGQLNGDWYTPENTAALEVGSKQNYAISVWAGELLPGVLGEDDHQNLNDLKGILQMPYFEDAAISEKHRIHEYIARDSISRFYYYYYDRVGLPVPKTVFSDYPRGYQSYRFIFEDQFNRPIQDFPVVVPSGTEIMIGNPFLSSLDFENFYNNNSDIIENYYRLFVNNLFQTFSLTDGSPAGLTPKIASFQGFFIKTKETDGNVTLHFPVSTSVTRPTLSQHQLRSTSQVGSTNKFYVKASNSLGNSWTTLVMDSDPSETDIPQLFIASEDSKNAPQVYLLNSANQKNTVLHLPEATIEIPLGVSCGSQDTICLSFSNLERISCESLVLRDLRLHKDIDLFKQNTYSFKNDPDDGERFLLFAGNSPNTAIEDNPVEDKVSFFVSCSQNTLNIKASETISTVSIVSIQGMVLEKWTGIYEKVCSRKLQLPAGIYLVTVRLSNGDTQTKKIIIRR